MHETKEKVKKLCGLMEKLTCLMEGQTSKGLDNVDTKEAGEVIDMIKDLADAEKNCWKACYYKTVVEAMTEESHEDRMGYDNWRYSSGRYAPKGRGRYSPAGYVPPAEPYNFFPNIWMDGKGGDGFVGGGQGSRMGYDGDPTRMTSTYSDMYMDGQTYKGMPYDKYKEARRHYTQSHSKEDRDEMDTYAVEHMSEMVDTMKDIWGEANPELKMKMKSELTTLMNEMK